MALKPWYRVVTPREDLREGKPLDASEFAVHLDQVRDGRAPTVYQNPAAFFERTYATKNLAGLAVEAIRRLNGIKVETSAVFNLATQFGGGKTHALTLLYHLARGGPEASTWPGVKALLTKAGVQSVPKTATAVFVGSEFDSITGRGGTDGTPVRRTPWGEIAWQLADGERERFSLVARHEEELTAPGGDVVGKLIPDDRPALLLLDELMNYVSRSRKSGLSAQFYSFLHNLSEVARSRDNVVLAVSIPASEFEMSAEDQGDFERLKKLLDRVGKPVLMSVEAETSEIIRRRLFEWHGLPPDAASTLDAYGDWTLDHRLDVPSWFPTDHAREAFAATYPFHPTVLSVFERKWQGLPRFQQTRGILRLLALWVSHAYAEGYKGAHRDPLITIGTAPLEDPTFRSAVFEQLGETRLEAAVTTDIIGKEHAHALRLDAEAQDEIKKARLHRKVATAVFFESNGGQHRGEATLPEVRLAVAEPDLELGNIEQALEALTETCYYLTAEKNRYQFSFKANLNKLLADRRASISTGAVQKRVRDEIVAVFKAGRSLDRVYFPAKSTDIPDRPALTLVVMSPEETASQPGTRNLMLKLTQEHGSAARSFKSALLWCVAEDGNALAEEARKLLAWEDVKGDADVRLDDTQLRQLEESTKRAQRDLREAVWRSYKNVFFLDDDNSIRHVDLGLVHSSAADTLPNFIIQELGRSDTVETEGVSPNYLVRNWPPALPEWSTRGVRDAFYASPKFPRLLNPESIKQTIATGVSNGILAYLEKTGDGRYEPFRYKVAMFEGEVEIGEDLFIIPAAAAEEYLKKGAPIGAEPPEPGALKGSEAASDHAALASEVREGTAPEATPTATLAGFRWRGEIDAKKWMNFYSKVLAPFATAGGLTLTIEVEVQPPGGVTPQKVEATKVALRDLGMDEEVEHLE